MDVPDANALSSRNEPGRRRVASTLAGLALATVGAATLVVLVVVTNCSSAACDQWTVRLGLTGTAILSVLGQTALMIGGWQIWRSLRGPLRR